MANNYTEGSVEFDIGEQGNRMLVALHAESVAMSEYGEDWRDMVPAPSDLAQRFYAGLCGGADESEDISARGSVELSENGVWLYDDENFPDDYFTALVQFVLRELKLPNVVGWECSERCDRPRPGEFGGFITCVSARGTRKNGTGFLLAKAMEELTAGMSKFLAEGGEL